MLGVPAAIINNPYILFSSVRLDLWEQEGDAATWHGGEAREVNAVLGCGGTQC